MRDTELVILDVPVAIQPFWTASSSEPRLAIAAGASLYIYHGTRIHQKVSLPFEQIQADDAMAWCVLARYISCRHAMLVVNCNDIQHNVKGFSQG